MSDQATDIAPSLPAKPLPMLTPAPSVQDQGKPARISPRIRTVIDLLVSGECATMTAAAARANLHFDHVRRELKKPPVRVFMERRARETIAAGMMRASARLNQLVDASSEHVSFDATKHVLALAGIKPAADAQVSVNIDIKAGYVIDLSDNPRPSTHSLSASNQAQVIDNVEVEP